MKSLRISTLFIMAAVLVASCGQGEGTLEDKKERLNAAKEEIKALQNEVATLEKEIAAQDPEFGKVKENATLITTVVANKEDFSHKIEVRGNVQSRTNVFISA